MMSAVDLFGILLLASNPIGDALNSSDLIFPILECFHIVGFALSIGTIAILDLRLLGLGMRNQTPSQISADVAPWTLAGLGVMLISGPLIFLSDTGMYLRNPSFQFKIACLLVAIVYNYTIHRKVAMSDSSSALSKLVGAVSLLLWVGVVAGGLFIAFY
jgi:hypothetical protein